MTLWAGSTAAGRALRCPMAFRFPSLERIVRDREHGRDRIDGKNNIGELDQQKDDEQGSDEQAAVLSREEPLPVRLARRRQKVSPLQAA